MAQPSNCVWVLESAPLHLAGEPVWSPDLAGASMATCFGCSDAGEAVAEAVSGAQGCDRLYRAEKYVRASGPTEAEDEALELAHSLAYEYAEQVIRTNCKRYELDGQTLEAVWFDLRSADSDVTDQVRYLQSRGLLVGMAATPWIVSVRDESEATA